MIIKFNLLPREEIITPEVTEQPPVFLKFYTFLLLFLVITLVIFSYNTQTKISSLESDKKKKEEILKKYKTIAQKVKEMERENEEVKKRIEVIIALKEAQGKHLRNMAHLFQAVEANRLLFNNFKLDSNKAFIKGLGLDMDFLAIYMQNLENNKELFKAVNLKTAQQKSIGDLKLVEFELEVTF